jgi:hypothetical protein
MSRAILHIPQSQQLRAIRRNSYATTKPTLDNRLFPDIEFNERDYVPYCELVQQDDEVWMQIVTSYVDIEYTLVKASDSTKTTLTATPVYSYDLSDGTTLTYYNINVPVASITGEYYVQIKTLDPDLPEAIIWTEKMNIQEEHEGTLLLKWGGNSGISDGMRWATVAYEIDRYQQIRIELIGTNK